MDAEEARPGRAPGLEAVLRRPVIAVLTARRTEEALATARALAAGGLDVVEVTLRTAAALPAIAEIAAVVPEVMVGAGTVLEPADCERAAGAGAGFLVSPGSTPALIRAARASGLPWLPAAATVSEAMRLAEGGWRCQKFFPAEAAGGVAYLNALRAPLPRVSFCPTGGVNRENVERYLACPNVAAVGGSWVAPPALIERSAWHEITELARAVSGLPRAWSGTAGERRR